ncbi:hypothetical protein E2P81_ATG09749 [Venturia nashicola]|uniref:Uncharacterized protein n=1 Tax=Venturia nashicola TaxID=86259 RepID=A0A4Z1NJP9_9PEZI|nr:hypothetical protein E6O75_ATG09961 [Venturia nashicola]TLD14759.1 hypothetical protein E2P81_ATG09749 [Venturia nashicola]
MSLTNPRTCMSTYTHRHPIKHLRIMVESDAPEFINWEYIFQGLTSLSTVQTAVQISGPKDEFDEYLDNNVFWKVDSLVGLFFRALKAVPVKAELTWGPWQQLLAEGRYSFDDSDGASGQVGYWVREVDFDRIRVEYG